MTDFAGLLAVPIAHLFDQDIDRLRKTAKMLGVRVVKVEHEGTYKQHVNLCSNPLERAKVLAASEGVE